MERLGGFFHTRFFANAIPVFFGLIGVVITDVPISLVGGWIPSPMYALMPIYFWCLVRPDLMSPGWAFVIGVAHDVLSGGPPGAWAASFVATYAVIDKQRDAFAGLSGWGAVLGFATGAMIACAANYAINSLLAWRILPAGYWITALAVTSLMYALALPFLGWVHRKVVGPLRSDF
jgi:rod shape-determining protein MreD